MNNCAFVIDSSSDANSLKKECINPAIDIKKDKIILQDISSEPVSTLVSKYLQSLCLDEK